MADSAHRKLTRARAAQRVRDVHGFPCTAETLATKAWNGSGPPYCLVAGKAYYEPDDVDRWMRDRIGPVACKTADARRIALAGEAVPC